MGNKIEEETNKDEAKYKLHSLASEQQVAARQILLSLFENSPIPKNELILNLPLFMRSIALAKILFFNELYQKILHTPGVIMEFGVWYGQDMAMFESFRAVYEPYNYTRRIVGFDTFEGYPQPAPEDGTSEYAAQGGYEPQKGSVDYLEKILYCHEQENPLSHIKKYDIVKGDIRGTLEKYLKDHPETIISLAFLDMGLYEPTKHCLELIRPYLTRGSVIALDELNSLDFPGETIALRELWGLDAYRIVRSQFVPDRSYMVIE
jgi:Macrocin-O-methyltransferase (TylF)